ncbi:hypothetical protein [Desulfosarcina ovata]|uniref:hypothetical protein n=1 Tax=Desulfosarcina ovata TaxID=83564 RepID=UPI0012D2A75A|nr:hypothetical protein [Desulfosarcina ovata]
MTIHPLHQPVNHIAGSMCFRMIIGNPIGTNVIPQLLEGINDNGWDIGILTPLDQPSDSLRKRNFAFGVVAVPLLRYYPNNSNSRFSFQVP